ncbi:MAG: tRNA threonylcarbamoyladenosine dehydratase [Bacillota bacterium]|jgi:tRNA A37 threonylcarbamoyladenosine dehydratase|nr:tRNA threonylcarbamoyladenosine dehydratase [Bacillota bacterium]NLL26461.1 tRNA threonylcarbamoyladenosine dehydratase [Erysipelotrichia bacterium]
MDNSRTINMIGKEKFNLIQSKTVMVIGLGGVGGYACETLVRSGIQRIIIIDNDKVDVSNINRQIIATKEAIGKRKTDMMKERLLSINPKAEIISYDVFFCQDNIEELFSEKVDYVVDAIDTISSKVVLWKYCLGNNIKIISSLGMAKRLNPQKVFITKLSKTENDPMAKALRSLARKNDIALDIPVVFSKEKPFEISETKKESLGSMMFVPATAGIMCGYYIINDIIDINDK